MSYQVGAEGQVVIEKELRDQLGIEPGWQVTQIMVNGHIEMYFAPPGHRRSLMGSLRKYARAEVHKDEDWHEIKSAAWAAAVRERIENEEDVASHRTASP